MRRAFFIVGPTATGKSELGADVVHELNAEIVSADAFQIYQGLDLLTAKPDASVLAKTPHHLISTMPLSEEMNAEKYRRAATRAIGQINSSGKLAVIVGGSGLYIKALIELDPETARKIEVKNRRRLVRALEICLLTGKPASVVVGGVAAVADGVDLGDIGDVRSRSAPAATSPKPIPATGVFAFRDREELYERINRRVEAMFEKGVIEEVRAAGSTSATASQMIGLRDIRELLEGKMSLSQLNLSLLSHNEAVKWILLRIRSGVRTKDD